MADVPPVFPVPAAPTVEQLLALLDERDRALEKRDRLIAELSARIGELEARLGKNSQNSFEAAELGRTIQAAAAVAAPQVGAPAG